MTTSPPADGSAEFLRPPSEMPDDYLVSLALQLHARSCNLHATPKHLHDRSVELSAELLKRLTELRKYKERLDWLHSGSGDTDEEGFEWGVARIKWAKNGQPLGVRWTASDHSDLDAEMLRNPHLSGGTSAAEDGSTSA